LVCVWEDPVDHHIHELVQVVTVESVTAFQPDQFLVWGLEVVEIFLHQ
jgi:hypothetical protein